MQPTSRSLLLSVALFASACGPRSIPERESPALTPTSAASFVSFVTADQRRDGVLARFDDVARQVIVERVSAPGVSSELFRVASDYAGGALVSRADDDAVLVLNGDPIEVHRWDGVTTTDLGARMNEALILAYPPEGLLTVTAVDLDPNGDVVLLVSVGGQAGDAPADQLCRLGADGTDLCEGLDGLEPEYASFTAMVLGGSRIYVLADDHLHARDAGGSWTRVGGDRVVFLQAIDGGGVAYVDDHTTSSELVTLDAEGRELGSIGGVFYVHGHSASGLWEIASEYETDGSCGAFSWSCTEATVWTQYVLYKLDGSRREVAHLDVDGGGPGYPELLPLGDGSLLLDLGGTVYHAVP